MREQWWPDGSTTGSCTGLETTLPYTDDPPGPRIPAYLCQGNNVPGTPQAGRKPSEISKESVRDTALNGGGEQRTTCDAHHITLSIRKMGEDMDQPT